jgi:hypothetical protein
MDRPRADQVNLRPGDVVYWNNDGHWRGTVDSISRDGRWLSVSYDNGEGDNRVSRAEFTAERGS